jgi:hypothetical protein
LTTGAWKIIAKSSPGTATEFGSDDTDFINKWHRGDDISTTHSSEVNSTTTFRSSKLKIARPADMTAVYTIIASAIAANRSITLPLLTADDTLVTANFAQTLLNKTISGSSNTISAIPKSALPSSVLHNDQNNDIGDFYLDFGDIAAPSNPASGKIRLFLDTATGEISVRKSGGTTVSLEAVGGGGATWDAAAVETLLNKTIDFANNTLTGVASTGTAQTLSNKTFTTPVISSISNSGTITIPTGTDTLVGRATTDILLNKTLTTPVIATIKPDASNSLNLPITTDTLVALTNAQTLLNKTIDFASNTLTDVASTNTAQTITNKTMTTVTNSFPGLMYEPGKERYGGWIGGGSASYFGFGLGSGAVVTLPAAEGTPDHGVDANGKFLIKSTATTTPAAGHQTGFRMSSAGQLTRQAKARIKAKFKLNSTTAMRLWVGLQQTSTTFSGGDDPLNNTNGVLIGLRSTDTIYQVGTNNGTNQATQFTAVTGDPTKDTTTVRTVEIRAKSDDSGWEYSFDENPTYTSVATVTPGSTQIQFPVIVLETSEAVTKTFNIYYWYAASK